MQQTGRFDEDVQLTSSIANPPTAAIVNTPMMIRTLRTDPATKVRDPPTTITAPAGKTCIEKKRSSRCEGNATNSKRNWSVVVTGCRVSTCSVRQIAVETRRDGVHFQGPYTNIFVNAWCQERYCFLATGDKHSLPRIVP
jgi:hypothetical protein